MIYKLKNVNKNLTSNKTKHVLVLAENEFNELLEKVKAISIKGLTKDLINKSSILNGVNYPYSGIPVKHCIKYFSGTTRIYSWKSKGISK